MRKAKATRSAIARRLGEAMERAGYRTRVSLAAAMEKAGSPITQEALGAYFRGNALPRSEVLVGLRKVLGVSIDWLLTGEEPPAPTSIEELQATVGQMIKRAGGRIPENDPIADEIADLLDKLSPRRRQKILELLKDMVEGESNR